MITNIPRVLVPINQTSGATEVMRLSRLGVDEFYFGFMPPTWVNRYGWEVSTNRRPYPFGPHVLDYQNAEKIITAAHQSGRKIQLAVNEHSYTRQQQRDLIPMIVRFYKMGVDALIVADLALIVSLKQAKIRVPLILSIGGGVYNDWSVRFFYELGIRRFILPRKLSIPEIRGLVMNAPRDVEFEIFLLGEWCKYNDDHCFCPHGYGRSEFCRESGRETGGSALARHRFLQERYSYCWCGLCILPALKDLFYRLVFKIPIRSDVFDLSAEMGPLLDCIKHKAASKESLRRFMNCGRQMCAYEV